MDEIKETTQNIDQNEPEKSSTWGIRLRDSEKLKLNDMLDSLGGERKETLLDIVTQAVVKKNTEEATTGLVAELETYTKAIMQAALRQVSAAAAVETANKAKYEELLDIEQAEKLKLTEQIKELESQIEALKATIKAQQEQISEAADRVEKQKEEIYCLKNDLETAQRNAEAVADIKKEYSDRLKAAEAAKLVAEKAAADAIAAQAAAEKATADANSKVANLSSKYNALNGKLEEVQKQLTKAENRAEKAEERADKLLEKALAAAQQPQHTKKPAAKATQHAEDGGEFEKTLEIKGQQKLVEE